MDFMNGAAGKGILIGLPAISFCFMMVMPSALQLYFVSTGIWALGQSHLLHNHSFRRWMKMEIPNAVGNAEKIDDSLARLTRRLQEEQNKVLQAQKQEAALDPQKISFIDRWMKKGKEYFREVKTEVTQKVQQVQATGGPTKNADGSPVAPPRLTEAQKKREAAEEKELSQEEKRYRLQRNTERRRAHMQALEREREKAKSTLQRHQQASQQRK